MGTRFLDALPLLLPLALAIGCGGKGTDLNQDVNGDDGGGIPQGNNPPPTPYQDPFASAPPYAAPQSGGDGSHHAGEACMQQGCHSDSGGRGSEAPSFLIGGTVYQDYYGQVPAAGVEVRIIDMNGNAASTYSGREGNFYIRSGGAVGFPAIVGARDASIARPMIRQLADPTMGACAQAACHVAGGSPASGAYYPIHVP